MAKVEIKSNIKLGLREILDGISKLDAKDIELFIKEVSNILLKKQQKEDKKKLSDKKKSPNKNATLATVEIRKNVSLDQIVKEQKTTPISYSQIKDLAKKGDWNYSLKELLVELN